MSKASGQYRELMQASYEAHREFKDAWKKLSQKRAKKKGPDVDVARDLFFVAHNRLWDQKLEPLQERFAADPMGSIDEIIDFLETDIPAFRCGYLKEFFLRHIKSLPFDQAQEERLKSAALELCRNAQHRRELRDWARLMTRLADAEFIDDLERIIDGNIESSDAEFVRRILLENRTEFKERVTPPL